MALIVVPGIIIVAEQLVLVEPVLHRRLAVVKPAILMYVDKIVLMVIEIMIKMATVTRLMVVIPLAPLII